MSAQSQSANVATVLSGIAVAGVAALGYVVLRREPPAPAPSAPSARRARESRRPPPPSDLSDTDSADYGPPSARSRQAARPSARDRDRSGSLDASKYAEMTSQLRAAQDEADRLRRQLTLTDVTEVDQEEKTATVKKVPLTLTERETIRAFFDLFDTHHNGVIKVSDISALHQKLGEPLTDEEAEAAMRDIDTKGKGEVNFEEFLSWWYDNHKGKRKGDQYTARFKLIQSKLTDQFDLDRVVRTQVGKVETLEYRVVFHYKQKNGVLKPLSPWHDVPLYAVGKSLDAKIFNFVCEVPKWTRGKFEIATGEPYNPIKQDVKNGKLRYLKHGDMNFNYGCFPRTWEDPKHVDPDTQCPGDNDPIDVFEIGMRQLPTGSITPVKILGILALIDDGETDWKVIAIAISDPLAKYLNDIDDVERELPGAVHAIREYMRLYKVWQGNPENQYALRGEAMHRDYAIRVVEQCHQSWQKLVKTGQTTVVKGSHGLAAPPSGSADNSPPAGPADQAPAS